MRNISQDHGSPETVAGLRYPGFSAVFIQQFTLGPKKKLNVPEEYFNRGIISTMENGIDNQIFNIRKKNQGNIRRFSLKGFGFRLPVTDEAGNELVMQGTAFVEMSLLFGRIVSFTYRFLFDGKAGFLSGDATTDHIIALLSTHLSAEHWSKNTGADDTDINLEISDFEVNGLYFDDKGNYSEKPVEIVLNGAGRAFDQVSGRYKNFIINKCSCYEEKVTSQEKRITEYLLQKNRGRFNSDNDAHYAMVDIWENVKHPVDGKDLFSLDAYPKLTEAEIIAHIRDFHKPELIGLMTLYPGEWPYRDPEAYDEVCGENIAIDTDDLVLVNGNVCVVIGTYGRRGASSPVDWEEHLKERSHYHVSWPEYLLILEMVLAKKFVIGLATEQLIESTLDAENKSASDLIEENAELSLRLSRMELQLDVVKYSKFMSHKVMFDRTSGRLEVAKDTERLNNMMDVVDNSLHNMSDFKSMKSEFLLNIILAIISVASTFELLFQNSEMPFLTFFGVPSNRFAAILVACVAAVTLFGLLLVLTNAFRNIIERIKKYL